LPGHRAPGSAGHSAGQQNDVAAEAEGQHPAIQQVECFVTHLRWVELHHDTPQAAGGCLGENVMTGQ
jgi:hypothetical protein